MSNEQIKEGLKVAAWLSLMSLSEWLIDDRTPPHQPLLGWICLVAAPTVLYKNISRWIGPVSQFVVIVPVIGAGILASLFIARDPAQLPEPQELPFTESIVFVASVCIVAALTRAFGSRPMNRLDRWCLAIAGLLLFFPVGIFFGSERSIAGVVVAPAVLAIAWLVGRARKNGDERDASFLALPHSAGPRETWLSTLSDATFGPVGVITALIIGIAVALSTLRHEVDDEDERILVASAQQIVALYTQSDFTGIAESMLDDLSLGTDRLELAQRRRIFANTLRILNEATGPCDESIEDYGVSREWAPKFHIRLGLTCRYRPINIVLVWGKRQNDPVLNLIGYQLPVEYYFEIPGLRNSARQVLDDPP